jgi:uncharacterized protein (DUF433 family)
MRYEDHFEQDPDVRDGKPVIKGTTVLVRDVMAVLATGASVAQVLERFPELDERDVRAVIAFAAIAVD